MEFLLNERDSNLISEFADMRPVNFKSQSSMEIKRKKT